MIYIKALAKEGWPLNLRNDLYELAYIIYASYLLKAVGLVRADITHDVSEVRHVEVFHPPFVLAASLSDVINQLNSLHVSVSLKHTVKLWCKSQHNRFLRHVDWPCWPSWFFASDIRLRFHKHAIHGDERSFISRSIDFWKELVEKIMLLLQYIILFCHNYDFAKKYPYSN